MLIVHVNNLYFQAIREIWVIFHQLFPIFLSDAYTVKFSYGFVNVFDSCFELDVVCSYESSGTKLQSIFDTFVHFKSYVVSSRLHKVYFMAFIKFFVYYFVWMEISTLKLLEYRYHKLLILKMIPFVKWVFLIFHPEGFLFLWHKNRSSYSSFHPTTIDEEMFVCKLLGAISLEMIY